ncbi:MAG: response regulator, partial [Gemmatimonadota bacterium]|nr:response regulator [Gemmatimonadota bacterium]
AVRRVTMRMLDALGYRVQSVTNGADALDAIERGAESFDLLLTDVVLPGELNGPALAERVRGVRPGLKILFASGYTGDATVVHGLLEQGAALLHKPFTAAGLAGRIREVLDGRAALTSNLEST